MNTHLDNISSGMLDLILIFQFSNSENWMFRFKHMVQRHPLHQSHYRLLQVRRFHAVCSHLPLELDYTAQMCPVYCPWHLQFLSFDSPYSLLTKAQVFSASSPLADTYNPNRSREELKWTKKQLDRPAWLGNIVHWRWRENKQNGFPPRYVQVWIEGKLESQPTVTRLSLSCLTLVRSLI